MDGITLFFFFFLSFFLSVFLGGLGRGEVNGDGRMGSIYIYMCVYNGR